MTTNLERHEWLLGLCTKNSQWYSQTEGKDMLNRCDFGCVLKVEMSGIATDLLWDCSKHVDQQWQEHSCRWSSAAQLAPQLQPWMQNVTDASLRLTVAGSTRTDTVVLLHLDSGALEHKVYTGCIHTHAASAGSRAVVSHGLTCVHQPWVMLQLTQQSLNTINWNICYKPICVSAFTFWLQKS